MPPFTIPAAIARFTSASVIWWISCFASSSTPSTSVRRISFSAASASASAPAAVSAFTL